MTTYEKIRKLCMEHGFSVSSIAKHIPELNVSGASVTGWKRGSKPRPNNIAVMAKYFNKPLSYFEDDVEQENDSENVGFCKVEKQIGESELKIALFGSDNEVTDEMWDKVKEYADYIKNKYGK